MGKRISRMLIILIVAPLLAIGPMLGTAFPQDGKTEAVPKTQNKQVEVKQGLREAQVKQLLLLMDTDKNGKISKQEWMSFMEAEFDRLDTDKTGELDPKKLAQSRVQASGLAKAGK